MYADIEELKEKGEDSGDEDIRSHSQFKTHETDRRARRGRTAVLYEDRDSSEELEKQNQRPVREKGGVANSGESSQRSDRQKHTKYVSETKKKSQDKYSDKSDDCEDTRSRHKVKGDADNFWRGSGHEIYDRDKRRAQRYKSRDTKSFRHGRDSSREKHSDSFTRQRDTGRYKTIGDECRELEQREGKERIDFRHSGFPPQFSRRRPFIKGPRFPRGRPYRGRGAMPVMPNFPMMPVVDPFYASLMQEFLHESGFKDWLKQKAKSHKHRSRSSSRSSRSHSRSKSRKSRRRHRRHSSYSDRSRSHSRHRSSHSRRRHSSSSSSRSRSRSRRSRSRRSSYSRSRSRSRDRHSWSSRYSSSSDNDKSRKRSRSKSSGHRQSRSRHRRHSSHSSHSRKPSSEKNDRSRSSSKCKEKVEAAADVSEKKSQKEKKTKRKKKSKHEHKSKWKKVDNIATEAAAGVSVFDIVKNTGDNEECDAEDEVISEIADGPDVLLGTGDSLESISSDNGKEWSSEEEGEL